jgi:hypothetical protein
MLTRVAKPTPRSLVRLLSSVGEGDTIVRYPDLIDALVAAGNDPVARTADLAELRALIQPFGFRRSMRISADELRSIGARTLFIWGDRDPLGSTDVARDEARLIPNARLEVLPAGHVPQSATRSVSPPWRRASSTRHVGPEPDTISLLDVGAGHLRHHHPCLPPLAVASVYGAP